MSEGLDAIRARIRAELEAELAAKQAAPTGVINIGDGDLSSVVQANEWVLLDLWAPWCGPCRMFAPVFEAAERYHHGRAVFAKMNVDENPVTSQALQVQSIPTLMVFHKGRLVHRQAGAMNGPMFERFIQDVLGPKP